MRLATILFLVLVLAVPAVSQIRFRVGFVAATLRRIVIEMVGVPYRQIGLDGSYMYSDGADSHWFGTWALPAGGGNTQLWDVNLSTGAGHYYDTGAEGRGNLYGRAFTGTKFYTTVNDPCHLYRYETGAGTFGTIALAGWAAGSCGTSTADKAVQSAYTAPNGIVVFGTARRGTIFAVNPADDVVTDYGVIDPPPGNPTCAGCFRYVYNIATDATYIYALMRDANDNTWWLVIVKRSDGAQTSCFHASAFASGGIYATADGTAVWYQTPAGWYRLDTTGGACPVAPGAPPALRQWYMPSAVYFALADSNAHDAGIFDTDIDDSNAAADVSTSSNGELLYRSPAGGGAYDSVTQAFTIYAASLRRVSAKSIANASAYLVSGNYGPVGTFDGSSTTKVGQMMTQSTYAVTAAADAVYLSGYPSTTYKWTPASPWTLTTSNNTACAVGTPSNPCIMVTDWGKYHYYSGPGSDGRLYVASSYERDDRAGGDIGWVNPSDNSTGSLALSCDAPESFVSLDGGARFAYSSSAENGYFGCTNTVGKLAVFDVSSQTIAHEWTPVAGAVNQGKVVGTADGDVLGIVKDFPAAGSYTVYKVNPSTGTHAAWSPKQVSGTAFGTSSASDRRLVLGPDGEVWFWDATHIKRVSPVTGTVSDYSSIVGVSYMEFVGRVLYFVTSGTKLGRIQT